MLQQIIKFNTDGLAPVYIDLEQVANVAGVEIVDMHGIQKRMQIQFKSGGHIHLNKTFVSDFTAAYDAWMAHVNKRVNDANSPAEAGPAAS